MSTVDALAMKDSRDLDAEMAPDQTIICDSHNALDLTGNAVNAGVTADNAVKEAGPKAERIKACEDDICGNANIFDMEGIHQHIETEYGLADKNVNTNGNTSRTEFASPKPIGDVIHGKDSDSVKKIKQINIGEIPLEPMGLSLSGSGMQLFVKLDPQLKKALMSTAGTTKATNKRRRFAQIKKNIATTIFEESVQEKSNDVLNKPSYAEGDIQDDMTEQQTRKVSDRHCSQKCSKDPKRPDYFNQDDLQSMTYSKPPTQQFTAIHIPHRASPLTLETQNCRTNSKAHCHKRNDRSPTYDLEPTMSRLCEKNKARDTSQDITNVGLTQKESLDEPNPASSSQAWEPTNFRSSDIPLRAPKERRLPRRRHHSPEDRSLDKKRRHGLCVHPRHYPNHRRRETFSSSEEADDSPDDHRHRYEHDKVHLKSRSRKKHRLPDHQRTDDDIVDDYDDNNGRYDDRNDDDDGDDHLYDGHSGRLDVTPKLPTSDQSYGDSSVGPTFDTTRFTPQTMDSETLAEFTAYTQDMRKDLKRRYKDLSQLLRNFNQTVKEKNQTTSTTDAKESTSRQERDSRCVVM